MARHVFRPCVSKFALIVLLWNGVTCIPFTLEDRPTDNSESILNRTKNEDYRLNEEVWPIHYDIEITPYFVAEANKSAFTFDGITTITITALQNGVRSIKLHRLELDILSWNLLRKSNSHSVKRVNETYDPVTQIQTLELDEPLLPNVAYLLTFNYVGEINDKMCGFYRSYFNGSNEEKVWLGVTQFQPSDARRVFPCFDEPKFKTTFLLKINHRTMEYGVYSNTPITSSVELGNNRSLTTFEVTPLMSTYLLAFIVAPFALSGKDEVALLTRPDASNQTSYGIQVGTKLLKQFGEWINYPFDDVPEMTRMYMAAVPDFATGAMENWGLITYKEYTLLYVPEDATSMQQQQTATIVAHELAHQWFGNLVTCEWWDVIWLNEAFATYMEYFGTAAMEPSWELEQQFVVDKLQNAMQMDYAEAVHPMTNPVSTIHQTFAMFDEISYHKGASVLRMMEHFLTRPVFQIALREYISARAFKTARPDDLFAAFNRHNPNAQTYMEPWTTQPGFPLVTVSETPEGFKLTQKRFVSNDKEHNEVSLWPVPITYSTKPEDFAITMPTIMTTESHNISVANASSVPYFILNNQQVGYYRVQYESGLWDKISQALRSKNHGGIHVVNRAQIVDDLFNLAEANLLRYGTALDILDYLQGETEYLPWLAAQNGLRVLSQTVHPDDEVLFKHYILELFGRVYEHVKFQPPSSSERRVHTYLRRLVLDWTCNYGHKGCKNSTMKEFERFRSNPSVKIHPDLREVVYCEGVRQGSADQFEFLLNLYQTTNVATERQLILQGLSCVADGRGIHQFLRLIHSPSVRKEDKRNVWMLLLSRSYTILPVTEYLVQNYDNLVEVYGNARDVLQRLYTILAVAKDAAVRNAIQEFTDLHRTEWVETDYILILNGLKLFDDNQKFIVHHRERVREYLTRNEVSGAKFSSAVHGATFILSIVLIVLNA